MNRAVHALAALLVGTVLVNTAMVGASAVSTLLAADALGAAWSGVPNAAGVLGTGLGALGLGVLMARTGRHAGLVWAYLVAAAGALCASAGVFFGVGLMLIGGMLLLGVGNAGAQLARYAAAELYPAERRGLAVGAVVSGGTLGAIMGPNLMAPLATLAGGLGLPPLIGAYGLALLAMLGAGAAARALPIAAASDRLSQASPRLGLAGSGVRGTHGGTPSSPRRTRWEPPIPGDRMGALALALESLARPHVLVALAAMVAANFTMVAVMTATPVHIQLHGQGLHVIGGVLSAHMLGMFLLSPLSGRLADWRGGTAVVSLGVAVLVGSSALAALTPPGDAGVLSGALFLLGYGWNLCYVGGSSLLSRNLPGREVQTQAEVDALVWGASTVASVLSGGLLAGGGLLLVAAVGGLIALLPLLLLLLGLRSRRGTTPIACEALEA